MQELASLTILAKTVGFEIEAELGLVVVVEVPSMPKFVVVVGKGALGLSATYPLPKRTDAFFVPVMAFLPEGTLTSVLYFTLKSRVAWLCRVCIEAVFVLMRWGSSQIHSKYNKIIHSSSPSHKLPLI